MTEPTDHRAEAEEWIAGAKANWTAPRAYDDPPIDPLDTIAPALIGIGHALLALTDATPATTINLTGNATREQIRDALRQTQSAPPLSPSEG